MLNYDPRQLVKYIVWLASQNDIVLTWVRVVKFLYLADLYQARLNQGQTLSDWPWAFVHFGPYCSQAYETVQEAATLGLINKKTYESHYKDRDEYDLFTCNDVDEPPIGNEIHIYVVTELRNAIKKWGDDTGSLLDYVYFETEPMHDARPSQMLDFSTARKPEPTSTVEMKKIPSESLERGRGIVEKLKRKHLEATEKQEAREKQRDRSKLYDEHYEKAINYMNGGELEPGLSGVAEIDS